MSDIVYSWPKAHKPPEDRFDREKSCQNCKYSLITIVVECCKNDKDGNWIHPGGWAPGAFYCDQWQQASEEEIKDNSFDWSNAIRIDID